MENKFSDGTTSGFAELPVPAAWLKWSRGDAKLRSIAKEDPGAYFGGWRAFTEDKDKNPLPSLPLSVVERTSEDGKHVYKVYASNFVNFLPFQHRTRFEQREKVTDAQTGREYEKVTKVSRGRQSGYAPNRQVFGLVYSAKNDDYAPAVLKIASWSAFIAFEKAGQLWNKVTYPEGQALIRRYGTLGVKEGEGYVPNFEIYGQGRSTPIEAVGLNKPRYATLTPEIEALWTNALAWKTCERWNAEGKIEDEGDTSDKAIFLAKCDEIGLSNIEVEQLYAESGKNYKKALALLSVPEVDPNQTLTDAEDPFAN
jgi:hypothetical protein